MAKRRGEAPPEAAAHRRLGVIVVDPLPVVRAGPAMLIDDRPDMEVLAEAGTADEGLDGDPAGPAQPWWSCSSDSGLEGEHDAYWLIRTCASGSRRHAMLGCGANADPTAISPGAVRRRRRLRRQEHRPGGVPAGAPPGGRPRDGAREPAPSSVGRDRRRHRAPARGRGEAHRARARGPGRGGRGSDRATRSRPGSGVRERTVTTHLARIYGKLGVGSRLAAIRMAAQSGLVSVGAPGVEPRLRAADVQTLAVVVAVRPAASPGRFAISAPAALTPSAGPRRRRRSNGRGSPATRSVPVADVE